MHLFHAKSKPALRKCRKVPFLNWTFPLYLHKKSLKVAIYFTLGAAKLFPFTSENATPCIILTTSHVPFRTTGAVWPGARFEHTCASCGNHTFTWTYILYLCKLRKPCLYLDIYTVLVQVVETIVWSVLGLRYCTCVSCGNHNMIRTWT